MAERDAVDVFDGSDVHEEVGKGGVSVEEGEMGGSDGVGVSGVDIGTSGDEEFGNSRAIGGYGDVQRGVSEDVLDVDIGLAVDEEFGEFQVSALGSIV